MPNFLLIDHGLAEVGGHNYQYAVDILTAAQERGYQPVVALRRQFPKTVQVPPTWRVFPVFRFGPKHQYSAGMDGKSRSAIGLDGRWLDPASAAWTSRILDVARCADRRRRLQDFESACAAVFSQIGFHAEDVAMLSTITDFDLLGLVRFLKANPHSGLLDWHVQMHFDIFAGREPDHACQTAKRDLLRGQLSNALAQIPAHRLHFYCTTDELCRQYNRLEVGTFQTLPYPARLASHHTRAPRQAAPRPLRVALAGGTRREKGKRQLSQLIQSLWDEFLTGGQVQLWLQLNPEALRRQLAKEAVAATHVTGNVCEETDAPIVAVKHPLPSGDYDELIRRSDVGLFIYDSQRYQSRCSGVLVEMLSAGVPVIVPAGCWLSEQIADAGYEHLDRLQGQGNVLQQVAVPRSQWRMGDSESPRGTSPDAVACGPAEEPAITEVPVPAGAAQVLGSFGWGSENPPGTYLRVETSNPEHAASDGPVSNAAVVGPRHAPGAVHVLAALEPTQTVVRLRLRNAYHQMPLYVREVQLAFLAAPAGQKGYPLGQVGLSVAEPGQVAAAVREMLAHRQHYQQSAREFSLPWNLAHAPSRTVEILRANR